MYNLISHRQIITTHKQVVSEIVDNDLCIGVFKCQYRKGFYNDNKKVSSFTYGIKEWFHYYELRDQLKNIKRESDVLYFKGDETGRYYVLPYLRKI